MLNEPERISFVSNTITTSRTKMVFLNRLAVPISVGENSQIIYYGFTQDISELEPYFNCAAYDGNSNVYSVLEEMWYLHDTSFLAAKRR